MIRDKEILRRLYPIIDWIWPSVTPSTPNQSAKRQEATDSRQAEDFAAVDALTGQHPDVVKVAHEDVRGLLNKEMERVHTAEAKLATLFALSALSTTLVLSVNGLAVLGVHWSILVITAYCLLQLICILFATLKGLKRRGFTGLSIADVAPSWTDSDAGHLVKILHTAVKNVHEYQQAGNDKITDLAIAYVAFRNFLCGLALLFVVSVVFPPESETVEQKAERVINEIGRHPRILDALTGPPEPKGQVGPAEPPEPKGESTPTSPPESENVSDPQPPNQSGVNVDVP